MKVKPIAEVIAFLEPIARECGVEIVEGTWNMRNHSLNLFIDAAGGVDLNLLERFHRAADAPLDELDPTFGAAYTLNCSSAGLDRPFKTARDYERHLGEKVEVHLYAPIGGAKYHEGILLGRDGGTVRIQTEKGEEEFPIEKVSKVCLFIEV